MKAYAGKVRLVFRQFPLSFHPHAPKAAEAAAVRQRPGQVLGVPRRPLQESAEARGRRISRRTPARSGLDAAEVRRSAWTRRQEASAVEADTAGRATRPGSTGTPAFFINGMLAVGRAAHRRVQEGHRRGAGQQVTEARERIAWAADVPLDEALRLWPLLSPSMGVVKVGLSLFVEHGPAAVRRVPGPGRGGVPGPQAARHPEHGRGGGDRRGRPGSDLPHGSCLGWGGDDPGCGAGCRARGGAGRRAAAADLAVTALTSLSDAQVTALGFGRSAAEMAARLAAGARDAGAGGLVCSAQEAAEMSRRFPDLFLCTPGIRPAGAELGDQARVETPAAAIRAGARLLVVGRPLHGAPDPAAAARALHDEVAAALL